MSKSNIAFNLAEVLEEATEGDGLTLGPTDAALAAKVLRLYSRRTIRRTTAAYAGGVGAVVAGLVGLGVLPQPEAALALDLNGDGVVNAMDVHFVADRFMPDRDGVPEPAGLEVTHIIETPEGVFAARLAQTPDPTTDYRLVSWRKIGPPRRRATTLSALDD